MIYYVKWKKNEEKLKRLRDLEGHNQSSHMDLLIVPEGEEKGAEKEFKEILVKFTQFW